MNFFKKKKFFLGGGTIRRFFQILKIFFEGGAQLDRGHKKIEYGISELKEIIKMKDEEIKLLKYKLNKYKNKEIKNDNNNLYNNFDIKLKEPIHILNNHTSYVNCLTILKDGRLVSGSSDKSIIIYNKETYKPDLTIKEHKDDVFCIITLSSGILASCSCDETIKLFNIRDNKYNILQTLKYHTRSVRKIIET